MTEPNPTSSNAPAGAAPDEVFLDAAMWEQLSEASSEDAFTQSWMALQCRMIPGTINGVVVLARPSGAFEPAAAWPEHARPGRELTEVAELAISRRQGLVRRHPRRDRPGAPRYAVAYPLTQDGELRGVVGLNVEVADEPAVQGVIRQLKWGSAWLDSALRRRQLDTQADALERLSLGAEMVAAAMDCEAFAAAATAVTSELATRLGCERVSFGILRGAHVQVEAISHSASFGRRMNLVRAVEAAMEEALDQERVVRVPESEVELDDAAAAADAADDADDADASDPSDPSDPSEDGPSICRFHRSLTSLPEAGVRAVVTVPVEWQGGYEAAMTFEWAEADAIDAETESVCRSVAGLAGPLLLQRRLEERHLAWKATDALRRQLERLVGPDYLGRKLALAALVATTGFFALYTTDYRITAEARLEGRVQRIAAAPFDAYVAEAPVRAGDRVEAGQVLARLDDREIRLDRQSWMSRRDQYRTQYKEAMAERDRAQVRVVSAQIEEAAARIELADDRLARTDVRAPFDAIVVEGDLSQSLGKAVRQGDVLFRLAPLESYRVILHVDERDLDQVRVGQSGRLLLTGRPDEPTPFEVAKVTPVTVAAEGRNAFVVEADLVRAGQALRPGMEGVAKIDAGERHLFWIWTHPLVDWLRLQVWRWWV